MVQNNQMEMSQTLSQYFQLHVCATYCSSSTGTGFIIDCSTDPVTQHRRLVIITCQHVVCGIVLS